MTGNSNGHDDRDGSGGSELVGVTDPVEVLTRAHNLLQLEVIWGIW